MSHTHPPRGRPSINYFYNRLSFPQSRLVLTGGNRRTEVSEIDVAVVWLSIAAPPLAPQSHVDAALASYSVLEKIEHIL